MEEMKKDTSEEIKDNQNEKMVVPAAEAPPKQSNKGIIIGAGVICAVCAVGAFYYFKIYDGGFPVTQTVNTYELGSEQDIFDSLKYDERKIIDVSIVDRGGFAMDKAGSYTVTFDFINSRKNHKQIPFAYKVEDTIAPELTVEQNEIYVAKGHNFNLNAYVSSTDISHTNIVKYDEAFDADVPGTYELNVYAEDGSGNKSAAQPVKVVVEDRDNCDVNLSNFGDSKEVVKRYEEHNIVDEGDAGLLYSIEEHGLQGDLYYWINKEDQLSNVMYEFTTTYEWDSFINKYSYFKDDLVAKYGDPSTSDELYDKSLGKGTSLWLGHYARRDTWDLSNMKITLQLYNESSNIILFIMYDSKEYSND